MKTFTNSSINILIGSKKFSEGWNCWRVSTMGLMNIGQSEGSEIIQLFGRGVRLKLVNPVKAPYVYFTTDMLEPLSAKGRVDVEIGSYAKVVRGKAEGCFVLVSDDGHDYNEVGGTVVFPKERRGEHFHFEDTDLEPVTEDVNWFCL